jgi:exosome complex RNA-binding protein Rrp42 (RNase PH superfamily)
MDETESINRHLRPALNIVFAVLTEENPGTVVTLARAKQVLTGLLEDVGPYPDAPDPGFPFTTVSGSQIE